MWSRSTSDFCGRTDAVRFRTLSRWGCQPMQVIAFMNMKGGVGKTTLAVNVAYTLAEHLGKQILIVDADPQFNATQCLVDDDQYLKHINDQKRGTIRDIFIPRRPGAVSTTVGTAKSVNKAKMNLAECTLEIYRGGPGKVGRLDLLPSTLSLVEAENSPRQTESRLKAYLREKAAHYDCVIIDCPPPLFPSLPKRRSWRATNILFRSSLIPYRSWDFLCWSVISKIALTMLGWRLNKLVLYSRWFAVRRRKLCDS